MDTSNDQAINKSCTELCICHEPNSEDFRYSQLDPLALKELVLERIERLSDEKLITLLEFLDTQ